MRKTILLSFLVCCILLAKSQVTTQQAKRLYETGKLWGNIKYFHPWLQYKNIAWDSAFVAAVPRILNTTTNREYTDVLQNMLSILGDKATYAVLTKPGTIVEQFINVERGKAYMQDSVLVVRINSKAIASDFDETSAIMSDAAKLLPDAKAVLFDLRITEPGSPLAQADDLNGQFSYNDYAFGSINAGLSAFSMMMPAERTVMHEGFKPEGSGGADNAYQSYFKISHAGMMNAKRQTPVHVVFLLNKNVATPKIALLLQQRGWATIATEDENIESRTTSTIQYKIDSIAISIRKAELVDENGLVLAEADTVFTPQTDYSVNFQKAFDLISKPITAKTNTAKMQVSYTGVWRAETYPANRYPDVGYRVLAAAKMYSVIQFFFPNKEQIADKWNVAFMKYLPQFVMAKDSIEYTQAITAMYANIQDSYGFAWSALGDALKPIFGDFVPTCVRVEKVENEIVVCAILNDSAARSIGLEIGDIIRSVNNEDPLAILDKARVFYPASNKEVQNRDLSFELLRGNDSTIVRLTVEKKDGTVKMVNAMRSKLFSRAMNINYKSPFKNKMPVYTILNNNIGYIDLQQLNVDNVDGVMNALHNTKGIIFDDRSYPPDAADQLFNYLPLPREISKVGLQVPLADADDIQFSDGSFTKEATITIRNNIPTFSGHKWTYKGRLVVLLNEWTQSGAEALAIRFKQAGAIGIGTHTAGANGDVTNFNLPGRVNLSFSGSYTAIQRTGIIPELTIIPTIEGVREGKDEVMEAAVRYLNTGMQIPLSR